MKRAVQQEREAGMSEASFDSEKNASQDNQSDPNEQGPHNTADSLSQSEESKNSLDETHMTEIDISEEDKEVGNHKYTLDEDDEDEHSQAQSKTSGIVEDNAEATSSVATEADVKVTVMSCALTEQQTAGAVVLADDIKSPAIEKLELMRKWSVNTYKCTKQILSEKLGRGSRTVDLELEAQIEVLRDNKRKYEHIIKLAQTLCSQLVQMLQTQRLLGDAFADLSLKTPELHEEFGYNAETQKLLAKNGETLFGAINFFISSVKTLVDKTIEDTLINIKQYEAARIEYDAYRTDLEELNLGPRDANTLPKIEQSQQHFQIHREKYEKMRIDVSVKLKFLEENKVKVLHNQLILFHNAIAAYFAGNQQQLEQTLKQFHIKLKLTGGETPSWLEEH
ncbi:arfaptin-1-like [Sinocyclocheilus rhinocerous]|uniref:arfaptin-1-like n=1 Tax=Sinocyclocheilus rhinocerous TaxID=307959 RepID=UPI0007B94827|nr:PREDICTED: arfaptin-1-like [Sinocyclocheilus rhinocerous]